MPGVEDWGSSVHDYGKPVGSEGKSYIEHKMRDRATEKHADEAVGDKTVIVAGLLAVGAWLGRDYWPQAKVYWDQAWAWTMEMVTPLRNVSPGADVPTPADDAPLLVGAILFALTVAVGAVGQDWLRWVLRPHLGLFMAVVWLGAALITLTVVVVLATATVNGTLGTWTAAGIMGGHMARTHHQARKP